MKSWTGKWDFYPAKNSFSTVEITEKSRKHLLLTSLNYTFKVFQFHDEVVKIKNDTELLAANKFCRSQIVEIASNTDSVQGVPESAQEMLKNCMKRNLDFVQLGNDKLLLAVTKFRMDMIIWTQVIKNFFMTYGFLGT